MKKAFVHIKGDVFGGLTAGIVALPLALAFGVSSGLGPDAGLYGAIFLSFFAALLGGTNTQISGPTAPMTAVSMVIISTLIAANDGSIEKALPIILAVFILAGLMQVALGFLKLGKYIRYIPYPVISGFMTAIGLIILITQMLPVLGYYAREDISYVDTFKPQAEAIILNKILEEEAGEALLVLEDFSKTVARGSSMSEEQILEESQTLAANSASGVLGAIRVLPSALQNISWIEFLLALGTIFIIYGFKRITTAVPSTLVALLVMTGIAILFVPNYRPITSIPQGFPVPRWEIFTELRLSELIPYVFTALTLSLLGAIDSLLTSVVADNMTKTKHKPNKELIGQGIGNSISAIFGGIPGAGATIRTVVNINSGGKTRISGMIAGLVLLMILLLFSSAASTIPAAVLAGILVTVGIGVMDYKGLRAIPILPRDIKIGKTGISSEVVVMLVVMVLSTVWNLVYAVGIGLIMASLMFMKKIGDLTEDSSEVTTGSKEKLWEDEKSSKLLKNDNIAIKHINGPLFFGSTDGFQKLAKTIPQEANTILFRFDRMEYIDQSGLYALEDLLVDLSKQNKIIYFIHLPKQPRYMMERIGLLPKLVPVSNVFERLPDFLNHIKSQN
ncbi:MAG: sodium-independent anion transporter [Flavobacteriaceae bacterium]|jgi:SulP family sulfate permease|nr:sodium-independent anion transporter [Flavobacteriaceae bacterium]|tara:strand:- start:489 stop:2342 length:1854 start_codon:yes stop_codon:yes gene_type:complete